MPELNVLVVDDSKTARFAMRRYLERLETLVQTAASAMEAYDYLKDHRPDVIFLDNVMPEISGLEALTKLKHDEKTKIIPVIFCTSIETAEFIEQARASGALQVLRKPPDLNQLSQLLADIRALPLVNGEHALEEVAAAPTGAGPAEQPAEPAMAEVSAPPAEPTVDAETAPPRQAAAPLGPNGRFDELRGEIDGSMRKLTDEICVQLAELKTQLHNFDPKGLTPSELEVVHHVAQEENEHLRQAMRAELEQMQARLDRLEQMQQEHHRQLMQAMHEAALAEARAMRDAMLQEATAQITEKLTASLLQAFGRAPAGSST